MYTGAGRKITPCVLFLSLSNHLSSLKDGYLDILTQAMPTASPYEVSTRPGKTQNNSHGVLSTVMITTRLEEWESGFKGLLKLVT